MKPATPSIIPAMASVILASRPGTKPIRNAAMMLSAREVMIRNSMLLTFSNLCCARINRIANAIFRNIEMGLLLIGCALFRLFDGSDQVKSCVDACNAAFPGGGIALHKCLAPCSVPGDLFGSGIEKFGCKPDNAIQFHALWHIVSAATLLIGNNLFSRAFDDEGTIIPDLNEQKLRIY